MAIRAKGDGEKSGILYLLSDGYNCVKIGKTEELTPEIRAKQYSRLTEKDWRFVRAYHCMGIDKAEEHLKAKLSEYTRPAMGTRECFEIPIKVAIRFLEQAILKFQQYDGDDHEPLSASTGSYAMLSGVIQKRDYLTARIMLRELIANGVRHKDVALNCQLKPKFVTALIKYAEADGFEGEAIEMGVISDPHNYYELTRIRDYQLRERIIQIAQDENRSIQRRDIVEFVRKQRK